MESSWKLTIFFGLCLSLDFISLISAAAFDMGLSSEIEKKLLAAMNIASPHVSPSVSKEDIVIPDDIRYKYTSLLRSHRAKRTVSKGIRKNPDIYADILYTEPSRQAFSFDISSIPSTSEVLMAELSVYKERPNESYHKDRNHTHRHPINNARVSIHQIGRNVSDTDHGERVQFTMFGDGINSTVDKVDERLLPVDSSGWTIFDVTVAIRHWLENPSSNLGLELRVNPYRPGRYAHRIADSVRASMIRHGRHDVPGTDLDTPVLTIYTIKYAPREDSLDCKEGVEPTACCRSTRYVDFRETQWTNRWIIEPAGFEAYDCIGPCRNSKHNGHRSVRDIFSMPHDFPLGPSSLNQCGIARSSSLPMMYLVERNGVAQLEVSEIPNMIIEECECTR